MKHINTIEPVLETFPSIEDTEGEFRIETDTNDKDETEVIEKPYDPKSIDIRPQTLALINIIRRLDEGSIDLYPDFQRSINLWKDQKQSLLIESILIRIPLPAFYFDGANHDKWQVIDGLQRLCAIQNFIVRKSLKLTGLEYLRQFEGCSFDELPAPFRRQIEETNIVAYILYSDSSSVKYNIFKRINTGGIVLNSQEIRNALNQGIPADFIAQLANMDSFKATVKVPTERMQDKEFITRFITFYLHRPEEYKPDLDTFMSNAMGKLKDLSPTERYKISCDFVAAMQLSQYIFGKRAFRKVFDRNEKKLYPVNKALFEVWSVLLSKLSDSESKKIEEFKGTVFDDFIDLLCRDTDFYGAITSQTDNKNKILYRFSKIDELLKKRLV